MNVTWLGDADETVTHITHGGYSFEVGKPTQVDAKDVAKFENMSVFEVAEEKAAKAK